MDSHSIPDFSEALTVENRSMFSTNLAFFVGCNNHLVEYWRQSSLGEVVLHGTDVRRRTWFRSSTVEWIYFQHNIISDCHTHPPLQNQDSTNRAWSSSSHQQEEERQKDTHRYETKSPNCRGVSANCSIADFLFSSKDRDGEHRGGGRERRWGNAMPLHRSLMQECGPKNEIIIFVFHNAIQ